MDNHEARFILSAYRPDGQDAKDPRFSEALEQVRQDAGLKRWFQDSIAFDTAVVAKLRAIKAPADLRESILTGAKASRAPRWKNRARKWAVAALVVLTAIVVSLLWYNTRPTHLAGWQVEALNVISSLVAKQSSFDIESKNARELLTWLRANHAPAARKLPHNLDKLAGLGCKTFVWRGKPVSVICLTTPDGGLIHFVTMNVLEASDRAIQAEAKLIQEGRWATATWRDDNTIYMVALEGSRDSLRSYLL
jgi:hypothetical protein